MASRDTNSNLAALPLTLPQDRTRTAIAQTSYPVRNGNSFETSKVDFRTTDSHRRGSDYPVCVGTEARCNDGSATNREGQISGYRMKIPDHTTSSSHRQPNSSLKSRTADVSAFEPQGGQDAMISGSPVISINMNRLGRQFATTVDGRQWTRKGNEKWTAVSSSGPATLPSSPLRLSLVMQKQGVNEIDHWALFVARDEERGDVYQVKADHLGSHYNPIYNVDLPASSSFENAYIMASSLTDQDHARIRYHAETTTPPQVDDVGRLRTTGQEWVVEVLKKLSVEGIVTPARVTEADRFRARYNIILALPASPPTPGPAYPEPGARYSAAQSTRKLSKSRSGEKKTRCIVM